MRQDFLAQNFFFEVLEHVLCVGAARCVVFGVGREQILLNLIDLAVVIELFANAHRALQRRERLAFDLAHHVGGDRLGADLDLGPGSSLGQVVNRRDDLLDGGVRGFQRFHDLFFRRFPGARLDHHQAVFAAGDHEIELALFALLERRVDEELAVEQAHPHAGDGLLERDVGQRQRRRCAGEGEHVGVVFLIRR